MSSFHTPDSSAAVWTILSLAGLILFGVGVTVVTDGSLQPDREVQDKDAESEERLSRLTIQLKGLQERHEELAEQRRDTEALAKVQEELAARDNQQDDLKTRIAAERLALAQTREDFATYMISYRKQLWARAIGTKHPTIATRSGKTFEETTIRRISATEIAISHRDGVATIAVHDLEPKLLAQYQLRLEEGRPRPSREAPKEATPPPGNPRSDKKETRRPRAVGKRDRKPEDAEDEGGEDEDALSAEQREEVASLSLQVVALEARLETLRTQIQEASLQAYGNRRSPPGSLETWEQRAARLQKLEARSAAQLAVTQEKLRRLERQR